MIPSTYCEFPSGRQGSRCPNCDQDPLPVDFKEIPKRTCKMKSQHSDQCPHLLGPTQDKIRVYGTGCSSERVMTAIWSCSLHGECIPLPKGRLTKQKNPVVSIMTPCFCRDCPDHPLRVISSLPEKSEVDRK